LARFWLIEESAAQSQQLQLKPNQMAFGKQVVQTFSKVTISLACPKQFWSAAPAKWWKPETINYRTYKPEMGGLFL
jgi:hypothetical protein